MTVCQRWCSLLILAVAFALRVWALDYKPAHFDEGVNGWFVDGMRVEGCYRYDPANYHGPLHFYVLFAGQQLFGRSLWVLRMPTVLAGTAVVLLLLGMRRFLGFRAAAWAAAVAAVSPALVFYSRTAIHEMWLPLFTLLACHGAFGLAGGGRRAGDLWRIGLGLAGMVLTKETYLLHLLAALLAWAMIRIFSPARGGRPRPADLFKGTASEPQETPRAEFSIRDITRVALVSVGIVASFYSGFFMNWAGLNGLWKTMAEMMKKGGGGDGHEKEMLYWLKLLAHYEWPALAGMAAALILALPRWRIGGMILLAVGAVFAGIDHYLSPAPGTEERIEFLLPRLGLHAHGSLGVGIAITGLCMIFAMPARDARIRWCALYGLGSLAAYSLIPYKTPWCIVNIIWPFALTLGHAMRELGILTRLLLVNLVGLLILLPPAIDSLRLNFNDRTERPNPTLDSLPPLPDGSFIDGDRYAYVQTNFDINNLLQPISQLVALDPANRQLVGHVIGESFPLSWLLNDFPNVRFHEPEDTLENCDADFLLIPNARTTDIEPRLRGIYYRQPHRSRGFGASCTLYLLADRFRSVMPAGREPELVPRVPQTDSIPPR